jgi:hypothetical protein
MIVILSQWQSVGIYMHIYLKYGENSYRKSIEKYWNFSYRQKQCRNIMLKLSILKLTLSTQTH